jgi:HSP20 family protein
MSNQLTKASEHTLALSPFSLLRMNPFSLMKRMSEEMDRMITTESRGAGNGIVWAPRIEVSRRDGSFIARAELPGMKPEQVKVEIVGDDIVIQGERADEREVKEDNLSLTELQYGTFYRAIPLPDGANTGEAKAKFENGVLEITVPCPAPNTNRTEIPIQSASGDSSGQTSKAA